MRRGFESCSPINSYASPQRTPLKRSSRSARSRRSASFRPGRFAYAAPSDRACAARTGAGSARRAPGDGDAAPGYRPRTRQDARPSRQHGETLPKSPVPRLAESLAPCQTGAAPAGGGSAPRGLHGARQCSRYSEAGPALVAGGAGVRRGGAGMVRGQDRQLRRGAGDASARGPEGPRSTWAVGAGCVIAADRICAHLDRTGAASDRTGAAPDRAGAARERIRAARDRAGRARERRGAPRDRA